MPPTHRQQFDLALSDSRMRGSRLGNVVPSWLSLITEGATRGFVGGVGEEPGGSNAFLLIEEKARVKKGIPRPVGVDAVLGFNS